MNEFINSNTEVFKPNYHDVDRFLFAIPESKTVIDNVAKIVYDQGLIIEKKDNKHRGVISEKELKEDYKKIENFVDSYNNKKSIQSITSNYIRYNFSPVEVTRVFDVTQKNNKKTKNLKNISLYALKPHSNIVLVDGAKYERGILDPVQIKRMSILSGKDVKIKIGTEGFILQDLVDSESIYGIPCYDKNQIIFRLIKKVIEKNSHKLDNGFQGQLYFTYEAGTTNETIRYNASIISSLFAGHDKSGSMMHLPPEVQMNQLKPDESLEKLSYLELISLGRDIVRNTFNYPVGGSEVSVNPDKMKMFASTINMYKKNISDFINEILKSSLGVKHWRVSLPRMLTGSTYDNARAFEIMQKRGNVTTNEFRELMGMSKVDTTVKENEFADRYKVITDRYMYDLQTESINNFEDTGRSGSVNQNNLENNNNNGENHKN